MGISRAEAQTSVVISHLTANSIKMGLRLASRSGTTPGLSIMKEMYRSSHPPLLGTGHSIRVTKTTSLNSGTNDLYLLNLI